MAKQPNHVDYQLLEATRENALLVAQGIDYQAQLLDAQNEIAKQLHIANLIAYVQIKQGVPGTLGAIRTIEKMLGITEGHPEGPPPPQPYPQPVQVRRGE